MNMITLDQLKSHIATINPEPGTETFIRDEINNYLDMDDISDFNDDPKLLLGNIYDEANDGAYDDAETTEPFTEINFNDFITKYIPQFKWE